MTTAAMDSNTRLTSREIEVLQLLARGCTYIQVGDRLSMSVHTVESHVKNVYRKLEVHSARAAVWRAAQLRLLGDAGDIGSASQGQPFAVYELK